MTSSQPNAGACDDMSDRANAMVITVSFMQIYTRLPVKVKVFTAPVKGCILLPKR